MIETMVDKAIDEAIDRAVLVLKNEKILSPFMFLINENNFISVVPTEKDYYYDDSVMVDSFKSFANEKLTEVEGYCVVYDKKTTIKGLEMNIIAIFIKMKNDTLPLKTRVYYFPYNIVGENPMIDFELAFASEM